MIVNKNFNSVLYNKVSEHDPILSTSNMHNTRMYEVRLKKKRICKLFRNNETDLFV